MSNLVLVRSKILSIFIWIVIFVLFTAFGAWVKIFLPFTPVPITLQTFFVLLSGALLNVYGSLSQILYVLLGASGLPIFAHSGGIFGPTGGYLIGFIFASFFIAKTIKIKNNFIWSIFCMLLGTIIIYFFGALQLSLFLGIKRAIILGVLPFIPGDLIKLFFASLIYQKLNWRYSLMV